MTSFTGRIDGQPWGRQSWDRPASPNGLGNRWACLAITVLAFAVWWPVGLVMLALTMAGGRTRARAFGALQFAWSRMTSSNPASSGNHAFDEYRLETIKRLEEEQREFEAFLERLRFARDKSEFDAFMTERRQRD